MAAPDFVYGTAWKEAETERLVTAALAAGFRAIDTANQRKHYFEAGVGAALRAAFAGGLPRADVWLQTKFTFLDGQDRRLPYDPEAPIRKQVEQSFASSLEHLGVDHLDSLILHGPSQRDGLGAPDHEAWRAMEGLVRAGVVDVIGISNASAHQIEDLVAFAAIPPAYVQNRCYAERGWDRAVRAVCTNHGIVYQGFSLLTANRHVLARADVRAIAARHDCTPAQIVFRFAQQLGMLPLTGTSDSTHMAQDLAAREVTLTADEVATIETARA